MQSLCLKYNDIFYLEGDQLTCTNIGEHEIRLRDETPINIKNYRQPEALKGEIKKQVTKMLQNEIICPSLSPWNAPLWIFPKKGARCRGK